MAVPTLPNDATEYLKRYGWVKPEETDPEAIREALVNYQDYFDLKPTGEIDAETGRLMAAPRCSVPDFMQEENNLCRWRHGPVRYFIDKPSNSRWAEFYESTYDKAWKQWAEVADIKIERVTSGSQANVHADWGSTMGSVLAWAYLPCGNVSASTRLTQLYGTRWDWVAEPLFLAVACHEIGHSLGLSHLSRGQLMQPTYTSNITKPQAGDIAEAVARYGKARPGQPDPGPRPEPPPNPARADWAGTF